MLYVGNLEQGNLLVVEVRMEEAKSYSETIWKHVSCVTKVMVFLFARFVNLKYAMICLCRSEILCGA